MIFIFLSSKIATDIFYFLAKIFYFNNCFKELCDGSLEHFCNSCLNVFDNSNICEVSSLVSANCLFRGRLKILRFFVCSVIWGCVLGDLTMRLWLLFKSYQKWWYSCFIRCNLVSFSLQVPVPLLWAVAPVTVQCSTKLHCSLAPFQACTPSDHGGNWMVLYASLWSSK